MKPIRDPVPVPQKSDKKASYQAPAVIYEGTVRIRAGTIIPPNAFPNDIGGPFGAGDS